MAIVAIGTLLVERYEIVRVINSGGMGVVYEARDRHQGDEPCAVKQLLEQDLDEASLRLLRRKFDDEMRFLGALRHDGIPRLRDHFTEGARQFIVMDLVEGATLDQELERARAEGRGMPPEQVVDDAVEILDILVYLHSRVPPVLHRDIKPANIVRERASGRIKLLDFGIARLHEGRATTHTQLGTLTYAPLEQIQGHAEPRSDVYALGATMHHLLSGVESAPLALQPLQRVAPQTDPELAAIVNRAVAASAIDRFENAATMRQAIVAWRDAQGAASSASTAIVATPLSSAAHDPRVTAHMSPAPARRFAGAGIVALGLAGLSALVFGPSLFTRTPTPVSASRGAPPVAMASAQASSNPVAVSWHSPPPRGPLSGGRVGYARPPAVASSPSPAAASSPSPQGAATSKPTTSATPLGPRTTAIAAAAPPSPPRVAATGSVTIVPASGGSPTTPAGGPWLPPITPHDSARLPGGEPPQGEEAPPLPGAYPGGRPPGAPPPAGGPSDAMQRAEPNLPAGWQVVLTHASERPPRKDFTITSPSLGSQAQIHYTVWVVPQTMLQGAMERLVSELQRQQWQVGEPSQSGGVLTFPLQRGGVMGALSVRAEGGRPGQSVLFATVCEAVSTADLGRLQQLASQHLLQ